MEEQETKRMDRDIEREHLEHEKQVDNDNIFWIATHWIHGTHVEQQWRRNCNKKDYEYAVHS